MLRCFICDKQIFRSIKDMFQHLKLDHGKHERHDKYTCHQGPCSRSFSDKYVFSRHILSCHSSDIEDSESPFDMQSYIGNMCKGDDTNGTGGNMTAESHSNNMWGSTNHEVFIDYKHLASAFLCEAKSHTTSLSSVQSIIHACKKMLNTMADDLIKQVGIVRNKGDKGEADFEKLLDKLQSIRNPFAGLESDFSYTHYLESRGLYIKPTKYAIGSKQTFVNDEVSGLKKPVMDPVYGQFISIRDTILALHSKTNLVTKALTQEVASPNGGRYQNFFDGLLWQEHPLKNSDTLVIRLYGDDFEPGNPLGSRKTVYKLGCVYFQFENMCNQLLSKTENMFLVCCYHSEDVKKFGWQYVLRPIVNELRSLESDGIGLDINGTTKICRVVISVITGENLLLNSILGFVESFSASFPCRHCVVNRHDFQHVTSEDADKMRTIEKYTAAVTNVNVSDTGIKQNCALNELTYFHATKNSVQDIMHDLFEGVCAYDLPLIMRALIDVGCFTHAILNHRLQTFDYGYHDISNKLPVISSVDVEMFTYDACQLWCVTRVLSLAVGDLVPEENGAWHFYLCLRDILDIVLSPAVEDVQLQQLGVLVSEYLQMRTALFPEKSLKNKHHHLIHYENLIRRTGPLIRYWCMRLESKHQGNKRLLHVVGNFKNLPQTMAVRHQYRMAFRLLNFNNAYEDVVVGTGTVVTLCELHDGDCISQCLGNIGMHFELYKSNWIEIQGVRFKPNCYVLSNIDAETSLPVFVHVHYIFTRNDENFTRFYGQKLKTRYFNTHFHAWIIEKPSPIETVVVDPSTMIYHLPLTVNYIKLMGDEEISLIGLRYHI